MWFWISARLKLDLMAFGPWPSHICSTIASWDMLGPYPNVPTPEIPERWDSQQLIEDLHSNALTSAIHVIGGALGDPGAKPYLHICFGIF